MKKKSQLEQPFIYIFALIVMAAIFFFGFKAITGVLRTGSQVELAAFKSNLESSIEGIYNMDYGSRKETDLNLPGNIKEVCFFDLTRPKNYNNIEDKDFRTIIQGLMEQGTITRNLYLIPAKGKLETFTISKITLTENPLCLIPKAGKITFVLENVGTTVKVT